MSAVRLILALAVACALILPASANAASGPCLPDYPHGAQCKVWKGKVKYVDDGDTLDASVPGDGLGGLLRVRIIGAQAMEQTSYRASQRAGDCHAVDATNRLEQLVRRSKGRIRVASLYAGSRSRGRRLRSVAVRRGGRWRDVGRILVSEGHALWWPGQIEDAANERYSILTHKAAIAGRGLFNPSYCGVGPNEGQPLGLFAQWDADGNDGDDVNGEWVKIRNYDPVNPLPLGGWYVRDSGLRRYTFPGHAVVPPNGSVTLYAGEGGDFGNEFFWNLRAPVFENIIRDDRGIGDGAYLFDPQGDLRAWMIYPCRINCTAPAQGQISLTVEPRKDERVSITNTGGSVLDLEPYVLKSPPYSYSFAQGTTLGPGQTIRVHVDGDPADDTATDKYWGMTRQILNNGGDIATFSTYTDIRIACTAYGSRSCAE
jgi:endonuclease YncB( thermonuclease family)